MNRVLNIRSIQLCNKIGGGLRNASAAMDQKRLLLVFAEGADGNVGVGECWLEAAYVETISARLDSLAEHFTVGTVDAALAKMPDIQQRFANGLQRESLAALSGIDMALWDLRAKSLDVPLSRCIAAELPDDLRSTGKNPVRCYASGGLYRPDDSIDELVRDIRSYLALGYDAFKIKVGGAAIDHDVARVAAVREAIGADAGLMVDANSALDVEQTRAMLEALRPFDLAWFEEPLPLGTFAEQAMLAAESSVAFCGNEGETGHDCVMRLLDERCVDYLQIDISICGGISKAIEYASNAKQRSIPLTLHSAASAVLFLANLHMAAAMNTDILVESHMIHRWLTERLPATDLVVKDSHISPPDRPGLGLNLTPADLE